MKTEPDTRAFWQRMADRYQKLFDEATTEKDKANWKAHLDEALAKATPKPENDEANQ